MGPRVKRSANGQIEKRMRIRAVLALVVVGVLSGACSNSETSPAAGLSFCQRATEYLRFEPGIGAVAGDSLLTETFVKAWVSRLDALVEESPQELVDDVGLIRESVVELQRELSQVDFNVLDLSSEQLDRLDGESDSQLGEADQEFRDYVAGNCEVGEAPSPLSDAELAELLGAEAASGDSVDAELIDAELTEAMAAELEQLLGVTPQASKCLASNLAPETLNAFLSDQFSEADTEALLEVMIECDISPDDLIGE